MDINFNLLKEDIGIISDIVESTYSDEDILKHLNRYFQLLYYERILNFKGVINE